MTWCYFKVLLCTLTEQGCLLLLLVSHYVSYASWHGPRVRAGMRAKSLPYNLHKVWIIQVWSSISLPCILVINWRTRYQQNYTYKFTLILQTACSGERPLSGGYQDHGWWQFVQCRDHVLLQSVSSATKHKNSIEGQPYIIFIKQC